MVRKLVILNQAANYLTIGFANAFNQRFEKVVLITGSVHAQGEELDADIKVHYINRWHERPARKKAFSYLRALWHMWWLLLTRYRKHEVLFVSVPPMGYLLNLLLPHRFSMIIWDVYPDALALTGMSRKHPVSRVWSRLNKWSFRKAYRLFTISEGMAGLLSTYIKREKIIVQPIWSIFQSNDRVLKEENPFIAQHQLEGKFIVQYSGNIGLSHRVEWLVELAEALQDHDHILIQIIGRGPRKPHLERLVAEKQLSNCQFLPFQSDDMFPYSLSAADVGVVMLDPRISHGSVPSKTYNLMAYGIPSLYVAAPDSELAQYARTYEHAICVEEDKLPDAADFVLQLAENKEYHASLSQAAEKAAQDFKRSNADQFVEAYLN